MAKYKTGPSKETEQAANQAAKATQRPGQTKEQTKLIAQGIQKGIEHYKKQQKSKARELDKKLRKVNKTVPAENQEGAAQEQLNNNGQTSKSILPWILLILSWVGFAAFFTIK